MASGDGPPILYCVHRGEGGGIEAGQVYKAGPRSDYSGSRWYK